MTRSDEDPEGDGANEEETETEEGAGADTAEETETETQTQTQTETEPADSPDEKIPLSELRESVEPETDESSGTGERLIDDEPGETDQEPTQGEGIPLSELRDDVVEGAAPPESEGGLFHEERVQEVEPEAVWADLLMGSGDTEAIFDPTAVEAELGREYQVVPKTLCHRCEYFGDPPTLHCTHEGTTIHETVDMDHYRVSECPMVRSDHDAREE